MEHQNDLLLSGINEAVSEIMTGKKTTASKRKDVQELKTSPEGKKKKTKVSASDAITLRQFVISLCKIIKATTVVDKTITIPDVKSYAECMEDIDEKEAIMLISDEEQLFNGQVSVKQQEAIVFNVLTVLASEMNHLSIRRGFSLEALKYFMVTFQRWMSMEDLKGPITKNVNGKKNGKTSAKMANGNVLLEYIKSPTEFICSIPRSNLDDIDALRLVFDKRLALPINIYRNTNISFDYNEYVTDVIPTARDSHVYIQTNNAKQTFVLLTDTTMLVHDGHQFTVPVAIMERELAALMSTAPKMTKGQFMILDTLLSSKIVIVDIKKTNFVASLPPIYDQRLALVEQWFGKGKVVLPSKTKLTNVAYIQKPKEGFTDSSYIYYKSNMTAAVIGIRNRYALLALMQNDGSLAYRMEIPIGGPAALMIAIAKEKPHAIAENEKIKIMLAGEETLLCDIPQDDSVKLFAEALVVEVKDGSRLGNVNCSRPLTNVQEYKPTGQSRDGNDTLEIFTSFINDPNNVNKIVESMAKSANFNIIMKYLKEHSSDIDADVLDIL
jgi:hypothetical protein